ncbi:MAG: 2Fe-2S iron-sulfur cluster-binding protein [Steroidobacteraceae bacterium]
MPKFHLLTVIEVRPEAEDAVRLTLAVPPELEGAFRGAAGQHIVLRTRLGGIELRRTYSLTGLAGSLPLTLGIRVQPNGRFSWQVCRALGVGDTVELMPPGGRFGAALARGAQTPGGATYVAFAAGSGITPILSIIRTALAERPDAQVMLFYGNRTTARTMFLEDLQGLKDRYVARLALHFVMSAEPQDIELLNGRLNGAKVHALAGRLFEPRAADALFICGPDSMVEEVRAALQSLGVERERIHSERFAPAEPTTRRASAVGAVGAAASLATSNLAEAAQAQIDRPADAALEPAAALTEVKVRMDGRRRTFTMRSNSETIVEGAARAGIELPFSCRAGVCSTCRTRLSRGRVQMRANYALEAWELEQGFILACQSQALTPELELDYDTK